MVNLATGTAQNGYGGTDTLVGIHNVLGSAHADTLTGDGGTDTLDGAGGGDTLVAGAGNDSFVFGPRLRLRDGVRRYRAGLDQYDHLDVVLYDDLADLWNDQQGNLGPDRHDDDDADVDLQCDDDDDDAPGRRFGHVIVQGRDQPSRT